MEGHARLALAVAEAQILQGTLAALVADGAVERMVQEQKLHRRALAPRGLLRRLGGMNDHAVGHRRRAAGLKLGHALDLDQAHTAGPDRRPEARLVAEDRDLDTGRGGRLDQAHSLGHLHLAAVNGHGDELGRTHSAASWPTRPR